ncbi:hypothetical protein CUN31_03430 [Enterococcus faecalis]|nr:predicted protein [Enterococcus faecalis Fly1]PQB33936.1 hypothetical protein CUN31_03430 [Enterococcus faecalis]PQB45728.1 hypothetical protein CUM81_08000 [Enterococcus faecalis]
MKFFLVKSTFKVQRGERMSNRLKEEQETILNYDALRNEWVYYSDVPKYNRKWNELIEPQKKEVDSYGKIVLLEGIVKGNVIIQKKRQMTDEQRNAASRRMKEYRKSKIDFKQNN